MKSNGVLNDSKNVLGLISWEGRDATDQTIQAHLYILEVGVKVPKLPGGKTKAFSSPYKEAGKGGLNFLPIMPKASIWVPNLLS